MRWPAALALCLAATIFAATPAAATTFCEAAPTSDGFVALRSGPSPQSRQLVAVKTGETVQLLSTRRGAWQKATYWPIEWRTDGRSQGPTGWIRRNLLTDCG